MQRNNAAPSSQNPVKAPLFFILYLFFDSMMKIYINYSTSEYPFNKSKKLHLVFNNIPKPILDSSFIQVGFDMISVCSTHWYFMLLYYNRPIIELLDLFQRDNERLVRSSEFERSQKLF